MSKKTTGKEDVPKEQFCVFVILPWCNDVVEVKNDNELVNIFSMFREHGCSRIVFEIDYQTYVPLPPEGSSFTPNAVDPEVFIDEYEGLDVDDLNENYFTYHGDDEDGGSVNGEEGGIAHNGNANSQVVVGFDDDNDQENHILWEGYQSREDDEFLKKSLCFMSDRQKGVLSALEMQFPFATTRFCARHIYANFRLKHSGQKLKTLFWMCSRSSNFRLKHSGQKLKTLFWMCSRSSNLFEFNDAMAEIGRVNIDARTWLDKINPIHWSRHAFDQSIKCDHVTNNMTESFNSMLGDHRAKTFLQLLEFIRRMVMKRFQKRKEECLGWKIEIPPSVSKKILMASKNSRILRMLSAGNGEYELLDERRAYVVKINQATCECGWKMIISLKIIHAFNYIFHPSNHKYYIHILKINSTILFIFI
ncbi:hypothetical protein ACOSQ2_006769 [Xanthoceras sorbifolium]